MLVSPQQVLISSIGDVSVLFKRLAFSQHIEARPNKLQVCHVLWDSCLKSETYFAIQIKLCRGMHVIIIRSDTCSTTDTISSYSSQ